MDPERIRTRETPQPKEAINVDQLKAALDDLFALETINSCKLTGLLDIQLPLNRCRDIMQASLSLLECYATPGGLVYPHQEARKFQLTITREKWEDTQTQSGILRTLRELEQNADSNNISFRVEPDLWELEIEEKAAQVDATLNKIGEQLAARIRITTPRT